MRLHTHELLRNHPHRQGLHQPRDLTVNRRDWMLYLSYMLRVLQTDTVSTLQTAKNSILGIDRTWHSGAERQGSQSGMKELQRSSRRS